MAKREKLTLRLEEEMIEKAKRFALDHGTSVSRMVASFFDSLETQSSSSTQHGPITNRLRGSMMPEQGSSQFDEEDYLRHLEYKHG